MYSTEVAVLLIAEIHRRHGATVGTKATATRGQPLA